ncbi:hypothetical protein BX616_008880, partial [Lobosporangium transversale]
CLCSFPSNPHRPPTSEPNHQGLAPVFSTAPEVLSRLMSPSANVYTETLSEGKITKKRPISDPTQDNLEAPLSPPLSPLLPVQPLDESKATHRSRPSPKFSPMLPHGSPSKNAFSNIISSFEFPNGERFYEKDLSITASGSEDGDDNTRRRKPGCGSGWSML